MTRQEGNEALGYLSQTRKGTMRSKLVVKTINNLKLKTGSMDMLRKTVKTEMSSEPPAKAANTAKGKRREDAVEMGQDDHRSQVTSEILANKAMVPPILMAELRSTANYKTNKSDCSLTRAALEIEMLSQ